jgi:hypothetical protein
MSLYRTPLHPHATYCQFAARRRQRAITFSPKRFVLYIRHKTRDAHLAPHQASARPLNTPLPAIFLHAIDDSWKTRKPTPTTHLRGRAFTPAFRKLPPQNSSRTQSINRTATIQSIELSTTTKYGDVLSCRGQNTRLLYPVPIIVALSWLGRSRAKCGLQEKSAGTISALP